TVVPAAAMNAWLLLLKVTGAFMPTVTVTVHQDNVLLTVSVGVPLPDKSLLFDATDRSGCGWGFGVLSLQPTKRANRAMGVSRMGRTLCHHRRAINVTWRGTARRRQRGCAR